MALTEFGRLVRKARIDADTTLGEMADRLGVSPAYLSALETGRKKVPKEWVVKIETYFRDQDIVVEGLGEAADVSNASVSLDGLAPQHQLLVAGFARGKFSDEDLAKASAFLSKLRETTK